MANNLFHEISELAADRRKRKKPVVSCNECHRRKQKCDRLQPCANCTKREKEHLCMYTSVGAEPLFDPRASLAGPAGEKTRETGVSESSVDGKFSEPSHIPPSTGSGRTHNVSECLGYLQHTTTGTLGLIRMAGDVDTKGPYSHDVNADQHLCERYKDLIRQLPSQRHTEVLVQLFFADLEWYYDVIDQDNFRQHMHAWNSVSYVTLRQGLHQLPPNTRAFPALLFQVLAHALLFMPSKCAPGLHDIRYAPGMTFADLATEYSESGNAIMLMLRKDDSTQIKVQAGLLRASFLKSTASVVEAWHAIGATIRDGHELGLSGVLDTALPEDLKSLKDTELRARLWFTLHLWDGHMGVVLGRPMSTRLNSDAWISLFSNIEGRRALLQGCNTALPPEPGEILTPFSVILCGYGIAYRYLQDIQGVSESVAGSTSAESAENKQVLEQIDRLVTDGLGNLPAWAQDEPSYSVSHPWLAAARETFFTEIHFVVLALHRPFIFSSSRSRDRAQQAALHILASQSRLFNMSEPREYLPFNLVFATFDAMVLLATVCILFSDEKHQSRSESLRSIEWGLARLKAMRARNKMAACAFDVVDTLYSKAKKKHGQTVQHQQQSGTRGLGSISDDSCSAVTVNSGGVTTHQSDNTPPNNSTSEILLSGLELGVQGELEELPTDLPFNFFPCDVQNSDIADLSPSQPFHDLIFQASSDENDGLAWHTDANSPLMFRF